MASSASAHCSADGLAMAPSLRVGILGTAETAKTEWSAIMLAGLTVTRVGSRNLDRAIRFVDLCSAELNLDTASMPRIGSYDDVVTASDVDVVYIPIPVTQRDEWVKKCIANNKHVVGEKPAAESAEQLKAWIEGLHAKQLLYMDGTMLSHGLRVARVRDAMHSLGPLRHVEVVCNSFASPEFLATDIRLDPVLEPMGALGDLGWYCVRYILHLVDFASPLSVSGRVLKRHPRGGIEGFVGNLRFGSKDVADPVECVFSCSFDSCSEQRVVILCADGYISLDGFINPTFNAPPSFTIHRGTLAQPGLAIELQAVTKVVEQSEEGVGMWFQATQLWRDFASALQPNEVGRLVVNSEKSTSNWSHMALLTQSVCDRLLTSAAVNSSQPQ